MSDYGDIRGIAQKPELSSGISADTASNKVQQQLSALQEADLQQKTADSIINAAKKMNDELNGMLSSVCEPIFSAIQEFKLVPPKIRSIVDVDGAAQGAYANLQKCQSSAQKLQNIIISSEVPITLEDYNAAPQQYDKLLTIQYQRNEVTEQDCKESGYTKVIHEIDPVWLQKLMDQFPAPEDRDVVGKSMEKLIGTVIKTAWGIVQTPIQTIASIAPLGPIDGMIQSVVDAVDNVVKIASLNIPDAQLNKMIAEKQAAAEKAAAEAEKAKVATNPAGKSATELAEQAQKESKSAIVQVGAGVLDGLEGAFENFHTPELPPDVKHTLDDFKDSIIMVKDNISNIYIVIILKMIGAIFDCFNQIIGVLGVPKIPDPLGRIPQLLADINSVMTFVMGLPMSLIKCVEAIVKRKMKMIQVCMTPAPPPPLPTKVPVPPTSNDVVQPDFTWDDVIEILVNRYHFDQDTAAEIVAMLKYAYDGSGEFLDVIVSGKQQLNEYGSIDYVPVYKEMFRYEMSPRMCFEWIESRMKFEEGMHKNGAFSTGDTYWIRVPRPWRPEDLAEYNDPNSPDYPQYYTCDVRDKRTKIELNDPWRTEAYTSEEFNVDDEDTAEGNNNTDNNESED